MVRELEKKTPIDFPKTAPAANPVFFRTYSRKDDGVRETWEQVCDRTIQGLEELGKLTSKETKLLHRMMLPLKSMPSGRWLWVGGTDWIKQKENFSGAYNCTSTNVIDWEAFGLMMDLAMQGCGTGAVLEPKYINQLPPITNHLHVTIDGEIGTTPASERREKTEVKILDEKVYVYVGDSRQGWVKSYQTLLEIAADTRFSGHVNVIINLSDVRAAGEPLKGFGGVANPVKLVDLYHRCSRILNNALGRQLTSVECCLLIDEAAVTIVAGNIRRSAGMRQGSSEDQAFSTAKDNLWQQDQDGNWRIDPTRDALRMANHSRVFHHQPDLEETINAVRKQYYSGEGAIQYAPESILRANTDLFPDEYTKNEFCQAYLNNQGREWLQNRYPEMSDREINHRLGRYGLNPCVTADTWVHTEKGPRQIKDLIGQQIGVYVNGELFSTTKDGFWETGVKPVFKVVTEEGFELRLTDNHQLLKITAQTQNHQYSDWCEVKDLQVGDRLLIHNHRNIQPWSGLGNFEQGWLLGNLIGDGCFSVNESNHQYQAKLRYWGETQVEMKDYALSLVNNLPQPKNVTKPLKGCYNSTNSYYEIGSASLAKLAQDFNIKHQAKNITPEIEQASYEFYRGFLQGLFDADGSVQGTQEKGVSVRLSQSNLDTLISVQRMLARLGIISKIYQNRRQEGVRYLPDSNRNLAPYFCKTEHELVISKDNLSIFQEVIGFQDFKKAQLLQDLLTGYKRKLNRERFTVKIKAILADGVESVYDCTVPAVSRFDANGLVAHNCGEIIGADFHCNLSEIHLNQIDPFNYQDQEDAFKAAALSVATLLNHRFEVERYRYSREIDPIVGVSFTGLFDFFVHAFGVNWLQWWEEGRPNTATGIDFKHKEAEYLQRWRDVVHQTVWEYCDRHQLNRPNRCTTVQPSGTKSLLTGASPGWHPPKSQRFIRRITFRKNDPVALACFDYGYSIIPSQSDKDENGNLLNDPFDPRCSEWLVEIPTEVSWANLPGADQIDIGKFSALAQFDFYMNVQQNYTTHNTSATIELRENEIEPLAKAIYEAIKNNQGYISAALLARFDDLQTFPRLPFEPIDKATYENLSQGVLERRKIDNFVTALRQYDQGYLTEAGPAGCDSDKCLLPEQK
jgi:ribonucleotide reductase class II